MTAAPSSALRPTPPKPPTSFLPSPSRPNGQPERIFHARNPLGEHHAHPANPSERPSRFAVQHARRTKNAVAVAHGGNRRQYHSIRPREGNPARPDRAPQQYGL